MIEKCEKQENTTPMTRKDEPLYYRMTRFLFVLMAK